LISNNSILGVIPARGGSKGLPGKNKKLLSGKPLISWTIEEAKQSKYIDRLIISSDNDEIIKIAQDLNCEAPFKRPAKLACDNTAGIDVALHAIEQCPGFDIIVYLQPTSPLRLCKDIDRCIEIMIEKSAKSTVSVCKVDKSPHLMYQIDKENQMIPILPIRSKTTNRQEFPTYYSVNGAVYVSQIEWLLKYKTLITKETVSYIMPRIRSIDIDDELDFLFAENIALSN